MSSESRTIGRRGESRFDSLCADAGVTCNRSTEDDHGWDRLIEFPLRPAPLVALDMRPGRVVAQVQIKATERRVRSVRISLSNALNYVRSPLPCFIVLAVFAGGGVRWYVRHVWGELMARWIETARHADAAGVQAVNREDVSVLFGPEDERDAAEMLPWMEREVLGVPSVYQASKRFIADTVGFEKGIGRASMTVEFDDREHVLDFQLGLRPRLRAKRFVYTSERFGIPAGRPEIDERDLIVEATPEGRPCRLRIDIADSRSLTVAARLFTAADGDRFAMRLASKPMDVVFGPAGRVGVKTAIDEDDRLSIEELRAFMHIRSLRPGVAFDLQIELEDRMFGLGSFRSGDRTPDASWSWAALWLDVLATVCREAAADPSEVAMSEVNAAWPQLRVLSAAVGHKSIRVDFTPEGELQPRADSLLAYASAMVGERIYAAVVSRPVVSYRLHGRRRRITFGAGEVLWAQVAPVGAWSDEALLEAYRRRLDRTPDGAQPIALGDLAEFVNGSGLERDIRSDLPAGREAPLLRLRGARRG